MVGQCVIPVCPLYIPDYVCSVSVIILSVPCTFLIMCNVLLVWYSCLSPVHSHSINQFRLVHLTSVTWWMDPYSAFFIGIFLRFGWIGLNLRIWITCSDVGSIFKISNVMALTARLLPHCQAQVKVQIQVRWGSGRSDLDLSSTLFLDFTRVFGTRGSF